MTGHHRLERVEAMNGTGNAKSSCGHLTLERVRNVPFQNTEHKGICVTFNLQQPPILISKVSRTQCNDPKTKKDGSGKTRAVLSMAASNHSVQSLCAARCERQCSLDINVLCVQLATCVRNCIEEMNTSRFWSVGCPLVLNQCVACALRLIAKHEGGAYGRGAGYCSSFSVFSAVVAPAVVVLYKAGFRK